MGYIILKYFLFTTIKSCSNFIFLTFVLIARNNNQGTILDTVSLFKNIKNKVPETINL